jgi:hypothetical protein
MRVFLSLLAPIFLFQSLASATALSSLPSLIESPAAYYYSVSWGADDGSCKDPEAIRSLVAIGAAVNEVLSRNKLLPVTNWENQLTHNGIRQLQDETRGGLRGLCDMRRCKYAGCRNKPTCYTMYNCDECGYHRQLIQTEMVLSAVELVTLQVELVAACEKALEVEAESNGYSTNCKAAMIDATCNALVWVESV